MYNILKPNINKMNVYIGWQNWRSLEHFKWIQLFLRTSRDEHSLVFHVLILFLKTVSEVSSFKESGVSSQIFGDNQKSLTTVICHKCPYFIYPIYLRTLAEACTFLLYPDHHEISHIYVYIKNMYICIYYTDVYIKKQGAQCRFLWYTSKKFIKVIMRRVYFRSLFSIV